jgi:hypothetical protein
VPSRPLIPPTVISENGGSPFTDSSSGTTRSEAAGEIRHTPHRTINASSPLFSGSFRSGLARTFAAALGFVPQRVSRFTARGRRFFRRDHLSSLSALLGFVLQRLSGSFRSGDKMCPETIGRIGPIRWTTLIRSNQGRPSKAQSSKDHHRRSRPICPVNRRTKGDATVDAVNELPRRRPGSPISAGAS